MMEVDFPKENDNKGKLMFLEEVGFKMQVQDQNCRNNRKVQILEGFNLSEEEKH